MAASQRPRASSVLRPQFPSWFPPLLLLLLYILAQGGCSCGPDTTAPTPRPLLVCRPHAAPRPAAPPVTPGAPTVPAGSIPQSFSVSSGGSATLVLPLTAVPGRDRDRLRPPHRSFRSHGGGVRQPGRSTASHS